MSKNLLPFVFIFGMAIVFISVILIIIAYIRKKQKKKFVMALVIGVAIFLYAGFSSTDTDIDSYNFDKYEYGPSLKIILKDIGVSKISDIKDETSDNFEYTKSLLVKTDTKSLSVLMSSSTIDDWKVLSIHNKDNYEILYYDNSAYDKDGKLTYNIYSYDTDEIKEKADEEAAKVAEANRKRLLENVQKRIALEDEKDEMEDMAFKLIEPTKQTIKDLLKSPSTANFPGSAWDNYTDWNKEVKDNYIALQSYVDSQNSFGATVRAPFTIQYEIENGNAVIVYLNFENYTYGAYK